MGVVTRRRPNHVCLFEQRVHSRSPYTNLPQHSALELARRTAFSEASAHTLATRIALEFDMLGVAIVAFARRQFTPLSEIDALNGVRATTAALRSGRFPSRITVGDMP